MIRKAVSAGGFYPGEARRLEQNLDQYLSGQPPAAEATLRGIIVPHAGYLYSATVAARAYHLLPGLAHRPRRVFILAPAHFVPATASIGRFDQYETPLGLVEVDLPLCRKLLKSSSAFQDNNAAHLPEHSLEVQLPFLQRTLRDFRLVPILLGEAADTRAVAAALQPYFTSQNNLFVFSSDLSHYHPYTEAQCLDQSTLDILCSLDLDHAGQLDACGDRCLETAMLLAASSDCHIELLEYKNSGDTAGDKDSVVGYAACAIYKNSIKKS